MIGLKLNTLPRNACALPMPPAPLSRHQWFSGPCRAEGLPALSRCRWPKPREVQGDL